MGMAIWSWMIRHARWCIGRFHVRGSGQTPYFTAYGHNYKGEILPFAETRLAIHPRPKHRQARARRFTGGSLDKHRRSGSGAPSFRTSTS
eukprot:3062451-Pyramimonas_sp.AAC.1